MTEGNHEKKHKQFGQHRDLNAELPEYETSVMNFDRRYALRIQKLYDKHTSELSGAGIRASFNRFNDVTVRTREVPLVHASCDAITLSRICTCSRNKWAPLVGVNTYCTAGVLNPRPAAREGYFTKYNALWILKLESLDHGCANHATEGETLQSPHALLWRNEASLLVQWQTMYFTIPL